MKNYQKLLCGLLSVLMVVSMFTAVPFIAAAKDTSKQLGSATPDETMAPIKDIQIDNVELIAGVDCESDYEYINGDNVYYPVYRVEPTFRLILEDETVVEGDPDGSIRYNGSYYWLDVTTNQSIDNVWTEGTYTATAEILDFKKPFKVNIKENPVKSVTVDDMTLYKDINSRVQTTLEDEPWNEYSYNPTITVKFKDGTTMKKTIGDEYDEDGGFEYNGRNFYPRFNDNQSHDTEWQVGEKYTVDCLLFGIVSPFEVTVKDNPIKEVEAREVVVYKDVDNDTSGEFNRYNYDADYTVTLNDGTTYDSNKNGVVVINGGYVIPDVTDDQSAENEWGVGTHTAQLDFFGLKKTFNVVVKANPFTKLKANNVNIIKGTHLREAVSYIYYGEGDDAVEDEIWWEEYYYNADFEATLSDGTVLKSVNNQIEFNGNKYDMAITDDQAYNKKWGVGAHEVTGSIFGLDAGFTVNIVETPVESVVFDPDPVELTEETDGVWDTDRNNKKMFKYNYRVPAMTITLADETVIKTEAGQESLEYKGETYPIEKFDGQYADPWKAGESYQANAEFLGYRANFNVKINSKEQPTEPETTIPATEPGTVEPEPTDPVATVPATEPATTEPVATEPATTEPAPSKNTAITITPTKKTIYVKGSFKIKADVENPVGDTTFKSSNTKIAKVNAKGKVIGVKKGKATITVTNNGVSKVCKVTVKNPKLKKEPNSIKKGKSFKLKVVGKIGKVKYKSSNKKIATVSKKGKIKAKKKGKVTITVTANGVKFKFKIRVK
ncbi:MAG: Ig-like domain-containing protein [Ruminococcus sp.]|nr:Ig-like domain-containing protein [Ruminococcus sp.]